MVGKGQPPKAPEDKRKKQDVLLSQRERATIDAARQIEAPEKPFGKYVREAALAHAQTVLNVKAIDDVFNAHNLGERQFKNNENKD